MTGETRKLRALTLWLWPLGWGAVAINLFFLSLIGSWVGLAVLPPLWAAILAVPLGLLFSWGFARHFRALIRRVDAEDDANALDNPKRPAL